MARQFPLEVWINQNLFSQNYLEARVPESSLWQEVESRAALAFEEIRSAFNRIHEVRPGPGEEALVEDRLTRPVLGALGLHYDVQVRTRAGGRLRRPDYVLFGSREEFAEARRLRSENPRQYFRRAIAIADAKYWGRPLGDVDARDPIDPRDPTAKMIRDLDDAHSMSDGKVNWAILTNGRAWRLFSYRTSSRSTNYYEVDLEAVAARGNLREFMYFYLFFARGAFTVDPATNRSWLDLHLESSEEYARRISDQLKDRIFDRVFERLAEGFIAYRRREHGISRETGEILREIFNGCLILLYRLLFLLYAESRRLLPADDHPRYHRQSLTRLKRDIRERLQEARADGIDPSTYEYWERLSNLFRILHDGSQALNVPRYNGNLFRTESGSFLTQHRLGDRYLAEAIELLTVDETAGGATGDREPYFDYSSLGVRHLGDIYEGLLEFRIRVAEEEMVEVQERGRSVWKRATDVASDGRGRARSRKMAGEVYIENSKHERRTTGSYFTPHEVVEHMVKETAEPVLHERFDAARDAIARWREIRQQRKRARAPATIQELDSRIIGASQRAFDLLFSFRVLDPAMGSGHFLVSAVDVITNRVVAFLGEFPENPISEKIANMRRAILEDVESQGVRFREQDLSKLAEPNLIKRMVMKRCIFGVDLNPMAVELAKLSLWLDSFTIGAPLSFLDHHLRCGNSLIGVTFEEVERGVSEEAQARAAGSQTLLWGSRFAGVLQAAQTMLDIAALTDVTWRERSDSERLYQEAEIGLTPFRRALDLWTAEAFGVDGGRRFLSHGGDVGQLQSPDRLQRHDLQLLMRAEDEAHKRRFFHWQLEFTEVYYERAQRRDRPGFDIVIGNPPYVRIQEMEDEAEKAWLRSTLNGNSPRYVSAFRNFDLYIPFVERAFSLCREGGRFCFIVPNKFFQAEYGERLRALLAERRAITRVVNFGDNQIFEGSQVTNYTCLLFLTTDPQEILHYAEVLPLRHVRRELPVVLATLETTAQVRREEFALAELGGDPWCFPVGLERAIQRKAQSIGIPLRNVAEEIIVGLQTSADDVYILHYKGAGQQEGLVRVFSKRLGQDVELESALLKPLVSGEDVQRYGTPAPTKLLLFPYKLLPGGRAELIPQEELQQEYRRVWEYLEGTAARLRAREDGRFDDDTWYRFGRHQNLGKHERPKLGVPRLVDRLKALYDPRGEFYLDNVDVNGILFREEQPEDHLYILALFNSRLADFLFKLCSVRFRGQFYSANKQFIAPLPIRRIAFVTPERMRGSLLPEGRRLTQRAVQSGELAELVSWVGDRLSPRHIPDPARVAAYGDAPVWAAWPGRNRNSWEQADVIHNLLAWLSQRMMTLQQETSEERRGFFRWLEQAIGCDPGSLTGRDRLASYERLPVREALAILQANQRHIEVDLEARAFTERMTRELESSQTRIRPSLGEMEATDRVIDALVYRLYGLTEEEIAAVEGRSAMPTTATAGSVADET